MLFRSDWHQATAPFYSIMSFFVVAGTVKPIRVSPVELVDYLLGKTIYKNQNANLKMQNDK
jgi:hypothetical protein